MDAAFFTKIFLIALFFKSLVESVLDKRNLDHILKNRHNVPEKFKGQISLADHQKACDYSVKKIRTNQIFHFFELIIFLGLTLFGGLELINHYAMGFNTSPIVTGLIFFGLLGIFNFLIGLPKTLYFTFVIEEKYGFNKMTPKIFITDTIKATLLTLILGTPIAYAILWLMGKMGSLWWVYTFAFLTTVQIALIFIYPTFIAPLFNKFTPLPEGDVKEKIISLLNRCGFKSSGLFIMDASKRSGHGNAYFTGFGKNKRIVFFDTLIESLDAEEIEAVLAHELGHMKKKHILKGMIKSFLLSFLALAILGYLKNNAYFFNGHGVTTVTDYMALTLFSMVAGVYTFFLTPIFSYSSRKNEYEADAFAAEFASADKLISSLVKMYKDNASSLTPDPVYSKFYYSHPPALERVSYLESLAKK